jgi:single-strand DNA-binding protein
MSGIEVAFFGALGRDAELKTSKAGKAYLRLSVRVGDGDGAQWVSVLAFDESAVETAADFLKGARVYVEGTLQLNEWTGQDGAQRQGLSVISWHCRLSQIGRNRPQKNQSVSGAGGTVVPAAAAQRRDPVKRAGPADPDLNDPIPF